MCTLVAARPYRADERDDRDDEGRGCDDDGDHVHGSSVVGGWMPRAAVWAGPLAASGAALLLRRGAGEPAARIVAYSV
ncbi:hypothetical protein GY24_10055 [Microterricola pindariensis]|uniref:Uncharacterized protein n=1 Tax=Microterricola pindariensis TaxID=478010 RepID=A0ABX5AWG7_9MICO|nr:hypothetical protein GY24_10055 [Microterricola pindariensis]